MSKAPPSNSISLMAATPSSAAPTTASNGNQLERRQPARVNEFETIVHGI
jgi:hypothetical protein